ncbi:alkene reductase [Chitinophaga pendula]|uniref:alkene reductase n=1 Tax=Chitinophaga TaxID=79328 RepID=UPI000BB041BC|nr:MULTISPECIES: alkene reductase [Chitinophaga]ASZ13317.1 alkene reductase [Chitinophaga sp. MD30]UCJ09058.1 alkene reductase [Chitinophaga pendula]
MKTIHNTLLSPLDTPSLQLDNRVVMAPMSRRRSDHGIPSPNAHIYYGQRAGAGLIIAENTAVHKSGIGYLNAPAIYNKTQQAAWKKIVDAVHARHGKIFIQLVHTGRIGHPLNNEGQTALVAPSAIKANEIIRVPGDLHLPMPIPEVLSTAGTREMITAHIEAAVTAIALGFDGVEIHGAHGFLPEQFLHPHTNNRTDQYGGNIANRSRFLLEIMEGVAAAIGAHRTGVRLSPFAGLNDLPPYAEEADSHKYIIAALQQMGILYVHLSDLSDPVSYNRPGIPDTFVQHVRTHFKGLLIRAGNFTADTAAAAIAAGNADLIAFGRPFISNPDLVERFRHHTSLTPPDTNTFYQGGDTGYIDYPAVHTLTPSPHTS